MGKKKKKLKIIDFIRHYRKHLGAYAIRTLRVSKRRNDGKTVPAIRVLAYVAVVFIRFIFICHPISVSAGPECCGGGKTVFTRTNTYGETASRRLDL